MMPNDINASEFRDTASTLARMGGEVTRRFFGKVKASRKEDDTPVTEADFASQAAILDALAARYPSHSVIVEEIMDQPKRHAALAGSEICWVVDPLDGTRNYARGIGVYATSVAVLRHGRPLAGAIYDVTTDQVYSASLGGGAFCDDRPINCKDMPIDGDTTIMISSFRRRCIPDAVRRWMDHYLFRNQGSLCLHLAWVAAGLVDAAYALECKLWDVAAGSLIIEEAGGIITDHQGQSLWPINPVDYAGQDLPILTGSPTMHAKLLQTLLEDGSEL